MLSFSQGHVLDTVPFFYKGSHLCRKMAVFSPAYKFIADSMTCMKYSICAKCFPDMAHREPYDLVSTPAFSKRIIEERPSVVSILKLAVEKHGMEELAIFEHPDFHNQEGESNRFPTQAEEEFDHKRLLLGALRKIGKLHPKVKVIPMYTRLLDEKTVIQFVEIMLDGSERVRLVMPYALKNIKKCKIAIILCMDYRFATQSIECVKKYFGSPFDLIGFPGSTSMFLEGSRGARKAVDIARRHGCTEFVVIQHRDCGYFGGSSRFSSAADEKNFNIGKIVSFREEVGRIYQEGPEMNVSGIYADLIEDASMIQFVAC